MYYQIAITKTDKLCHVHCQALTEFMGSSVKTVLDITETVPKAKVESDDAYLFVDLFENNEGEATVIILSENKHTHSFLQKLGLEFNDEESIGWKKRVKDPVINRKTFSEDVGYISDDRKGFVSATTAAATAKKSPSELSIIDEFVRDLNKEYSGEWSTVGNEILVFDWQEGTTQFYSFLNVEHWNDKLPDLAIVAGIFETLTREYGGMTYLNKDDKWFKTTSLWEKGMKIGTLDTLFENPYYGMTPETFDLEDFHYRITDGALLRMGNKNALTKIVMSK